MSKWLQNLCVAGLAVLVMAPVAFGQQPGGQRGRGGMGMRSPTQLPRQLEVTDEQKAKLAEIEKKYADKLKAAQDKAKLTEEQTTAMRDAMPKAREAAQGKEGEAARTARQEVLDAALKLTDDQKKGREELAALTKEITTEVEALLTDAQKEKLKELRAAGARGGARGNRPAPN